MSNTYPNHREYPDPRIYDDDVFQVGQVVTIDPATGHDPGQVPAYDRPSNPDTALEYPPAPSGPDPNDPFTLVSLTPNTGTQNVPMVIDIAGSGFIDGDVPMIAGQFPTTPSTVTFVSDTHLTWNFTYDWHGTLTITIYRPSNSHWNNGGSQSLTVAMA
jgi:hypothetical protein